MPPEDMAQLGPYRIGIQVGKWENGRTPEDGPPDSVEQLGRWFEGQDEITDPERVADLEAKFRAKYGEEAI